MEGDYVRCDWLIIMLAFLSCEAQPPGPCWFCLASPEVEKHLVVNIGTHVSYSHRRAAEKEMPVTWFLLTFLDHVSNLPPLRSFLCESGSFYVALAALELT